MVLHHLAWQCVHQLPAIIIMTLLQWPLSLRLLILLRCFRHQSKATLITIVVLLTLPWHCVRQLPVLLLPKLLPSHQLEQIALRRSVQVERRLVEGLLDGVHLFTALECIVISLHQTIIQRKAKEFFMRNATRIYCYLKVKYFVCA